ncbi:MAG: N-acetylmuramoyl-L-alanine amidase [Clostridiaceae bacterium]|jgi:N-acetylmuramoyl-L-alanine amidase CwlD|nr:N-acetylmuramoyl-L-alanine amidase [Clostridiaceae bacterium]
MNRIRKHNYTSKRNASTSKSGYYRSRYSIEYLATLMILVLLIISLVVMFTDKKSKAAVHTIAETSTSLNTLTIETTPSTIPAYSYHAGTSALSGEPSVDETVPTTTSVENLTPISSIQMLEMDSSALILDNSTPSDVELSSRSNIPNHNDASKSDTLSPSTSSIIVVIDPGHGGIDPGTCSIYKEGLYEKDINLDIGLKLRKMLEDSGISVVMTRETDTLVYKSKTYNYNENILERPRIANKNNATLFISIHVNAFDTKISGGEKYNGTEVYYTNKTHGEYTNKQFAEIMGNAIDAKTDTKYNGIRNKNLGVLRLSNMPALLIETGYLTNKEDHKRLESDEFRADMAEGIYDGTIKILQTIGVL